MKVAIVLVSYADIRWHMHRLASFNLPWICFRTVVNAGEIIKIYSVGVYVEVISDYGLVLERRDITFNSIQFCC